MDGGAERGRGYSDESIAATIRDYLSEKPESFLFMLSPFKRRNRKPGPSCSKHR